MTNFKKATEIKKDYVDAYIHMGKVFDKLQNYKNAIKSYNTAI